VVTGCNPQNAVLVPTGGSGVIAIVDANHAPNAMADLNVFSQNFGLPLVDPTSFQVVYATSAGTTTLTPPAYDSGWEMEISLDIQWAHAMAPNAKIILVEANSANLNDMFAAVSLAGKLVTAGFGGQVSNSWGTSEYFGEATTIRPSPVPTWCTSRRVGTTPEPRIPRFPPMSSPSAARNRTTGNYVSQSAWTSGGGGPSRYEKRPSYQSSISRTVGNARGIPDVSAVADPNSGVWIYDSAAGGWIVVGGTSVATPVVAGITNLRGGVFSLSSTAELTYIYGNQSHYTDITAGNCRTHRAMTHWDFCTGVGVPKGP
jgi:subtilase family serine protease